MAITPGNQTSEHLLAKYGAAISAAAPVVAALAARYLDAPITSDQVVELANHAIVGAAAIISAYAVGRSIVKSRNK